MKEKSFSLKEMIQLFCVFFKIGAVTFGGGLAMLPIIEKELVTKRGWVTKDVLLDYFAIGQATPGIIAVNVATFLGHSRAGFLGSLFATLGVISPSIIIISLIASFLSNFNENISVKKALAGVNIVVAALLCKVLWGFRKKIFASVFSVILFIIAFVGIAFFNINTVVIVVFSILCGLGVFFFSERKKTDLKITLSTNEEKLDTSETKNPIEKDSSKDVQL